MRLRYMMIYLLILLNINTFAAITNTNTNTNTKNLPIFGLSFINQANSDTNFNKINVKDNYKLKVGDNLQAKVYGYDNINLKLAVDKKGNISLPKLGPLKVIDIEFGNVKKIIKNSLKEIYPNSDSIISFTDIASVEITINGNVKKPGTYYIGAFSTLTDALRRANGINNNSSLRNIEILRDGTIIKVDLYKYLLGSKNFNELLMKDGDIINIKNAKMQISIDGAIEQRGKFELKDNENLTTLLFYSKGLKANANIKNITIKRIEKNIGLTLSYININDDIKLNNGDFILIPYLKKNNFDNVEIKGEVYSPGNYLYKKNMTLQDLLNKSEGFKYTANKSNIIITSTKIENDTRILTTTGGNKLTTILKPYDVVYIPKVNNWNSIINVNIFGMVNSTGNYALQKGSNIYDLLLLAKGTTKSANIKAAYIIRKSLINKQIKIKQNLISKLQAQLSSSIYSSIFASDNLTESKVKIMNIQKQISLLQSDIKNKSSVDGKISLNLTSKYNTKDENWNFELNDGDSLYIPNIENYIYVEGAVLHPATFIYNKSSSIKKYINKSGGFSNEFNKNSSYILHPNGEASKFDFDYKLIPGDIIIVGKKVTNAK